MWLPALFDAIHAVGVCHQLSIDGYTDDFACASGHPPNGGAWYPREALIISRGWQFHQNMKALGYAMKSFISDQSGQPCYAVPVGAQTARDMCTDQRRHRPTGARMQQALKGLIIMTAHRRQFGSGTLRAVRSTAQQPACQWRGRSGRRNTCLRASL